MTAPYSFNQANRDNLAGLLQFFMHKYIQNVDDMLPAKVIAYDRTSNRARVQPLINMVSTEDKIVPRAQIASVPVMQLGGGGFVVSPPIVTGDLGWIKANDRDISFFKQGMNQSQPNTQRLHSFEDALFIPDTMLNGFTIAPEDENNFVIQNSNGNVKISWWQNLLKIIAPRVGIGGTPNVNAIFDVQSANKASMPFPRMTTAQRNAIPSPQEGMFVWLTDAHALSSYNGTLWS
jgi:hypothetical protein